MIPDSGPVIVTDSERDDAAVRFLLEQVGITVEGVYNMPNIVSKIASLDICSYPERAVRAEDPAPVSVCIETAKPASAVMDSEEVSSTVTAPVPGNTRDDSDTDSAELDS